jgi:hypothetical protein
MIDARDLESRLPEESPEVDGGELGPSLLYGADQVSCLVPELLAEHQ